MILFLSWGSDAQTQMHTATVGNEPETARRLSQSIEQANRIIESWLLSKGGKLIGYEGGSGTAEIDAEHIGELEDLSEQYSKAINEGRVWMGVGTELKEAMVAAEAAYERGGEGQIVLYTPDVAQELNEQSAEEVDDDLFGPSSDDVLVKFDQQAPPGEATAVERGTAPAPSPMSPLSQGASQLPSVPSVPSQDDGQPQPTPGQPQNQQQLKQAIVEVLKGIRSQVGFFEQVKESNPSAYEAVMGLVEAMLALAKQVMGPQAPTAQQAGLSKAEEVLAKMAVIHNDPENPTTVWRLQNDKGHGPYARGGSFGSSRPNTQQWISENFRDRPFSRYNQVTAVTGFKPKIQPLDPKGRPIGSEGQPMPYADFNLKDYQDFARNHKHVRFAFPSEEAATEWFGPYGIESYRGQGYKLTPVKASKVWRSKSGKQVFYIPHGLEPQTSLFRPPVRKAEILKLAEILAKNDPELGMKIVKLMELVPLAKMAQIHDNLTQPMMVWRIQNAKGIGPYMAENGPAGMESQHTAPDPVEDFTPQDQSQAKYDPEGFGIDWFEGRAAKPSFKKGSPKFAFLKPEDAHAWFGPGMIDQMKAKGFNLVQVPASKVWLSESGKQVMYHPAPAIKKNEELDPTEVPPKGSVLVKDALPGGVADKTDPKQFPKDLLREGAQHEMEHTDDPKIATEIAMDHLKEDPLYYRKLKAAGLDKGELRKVAPPGVSEETMHKLKAKYGTESAFKIAWSAHNKAKKAEMCAECSKKDCECLEKKGLLAAMSAAGTKDSRKGDIAKPPPDISAQPSPPDIRKEEPKPAAHHKVNLPVGTVLNGTGRQGGGAQQADTGKVKEINAQGKSVWRQERRGRRLADPDQEGGSSKSAQVKVPPKEVGPATEKVGTSLGDGS